MLLATLSCKDNDTVILIWQQYSKTDGIKSKYKEPKHFAKENFSENEIEVELNRTWSGDKSILALPSLCQNKKIYRKFVHRKLETRVTILKLKDEFNISDREMKNVFLPFKVLTEVKSHDRSNTDLLIGVSISILFLKELVYYTRNILWWRARNNRAFVFWMYIFPAILEQS